MLNLRKSIELSQHRWKLTLLVTKTEHAVDAAVLWREAGELTLCMEETVS